MCFCNKNLRTPFCDSEKCQQERYKNNKDITTETVLQNIYPGDLREIAKRIVEQGVVIPHKDLSIILKRAANTIKDLQDFVIWMTGCGYDFCQHEYFCRKRDTLLKEQKITGFNKQYTRFLQAVNKNTSVGSILYRGGTLEDCVILLVEQNIDLQKELTKVAMYRTSSDAYMLHGDNIYEVDLSKTSHIKEKHEKKPKEYVRTINVFKATQWFKNGDHPEDGKEVFKKGKHKGELVEGKVVRYYRSPDLDGQHTCNQCKDIMHNHGWVDNLDTGSVVCPGDFIVGNTKGYCAYSPDVFKNTFKEIK